MSDKVSQFPRPAAESTLGTANDPAVERFLRLLANIDKRRLAQK